MRPDKGLVVAGRYRLERPLASGGMGSVWVATHLGLDAQVAVKFMSEEVASAPSGRARFEREAKAAARLTSPHVVRATDYGVEEGTPFMVMELLAGESLDARLKAVEHLDADVVARVLRQVTKGLAEAHGQGIVHRDLKPANIFLARVGDEEIAKVLDFGIAKETNKALVQDDDTKSGTLLGSPQHMSPEQARGGDVDARSDLWSLGVVAFRALTGKRPFAGSNMADVVAKICVDPIPMPSEARFELGTAFDPFFERAFSRNPTLRFQTARELADAFDEAAGHRSDASLPLSRSRGAEALAPRAESTLGLMARASSVDTVELTNTGTTQDRPAPPAPRKTPLKVGLALVALGALAAGTVFFIESRGHAPAADPGAATAPSTAAPPPAPTSAPEAPGASASVSTSASAVPPRRAVPPRAAPRPAPKRPSDPFF